jgi:probable HAF family extracellular repeat protein
MKFRALTCIFAMTLFGALAIPVRLVAQAQKEAKSEHQRYKFIDIGTLGGPASYSSAEGDGSLVLNNRGMVAAYGDTSAADPYAPKCFDADCYLAQAFRWQNGVTTDLGALPGANNSAISGINERGWIAGFSENGVIDPVAGFPAVHAVLWKDGEIIDLGTLGGYESNAVSVNNEGQVVGFSTINATPDPFSFIGAPTHTFIWKNGVMQDLGTLGGPDSFPSAGGINERNGLVAGGSYINSTPNSVTDACGQNVPTMDPFLWRNGKMLDLGTLGGTCGFAVVANNRGQVVGLSDLAGDLEIHPFLWDRGTLTDLGTFGGDYGQPFWINDEGDVVGIANYPGNLMWHGFLWRQGVMTDLGTVAGDTCSEAESINSEGQVVGASGICFQTARAFL